MLLICVPMFVGAQTVASSETIFDELVKSEAGKGNVEIHQTTAIRNLVGRRMSGSSVEKVGDDAFLKIMGYRVQIFSGNDQRRSKAEAFSKERQVKETFPDIMTYVTYRAPFWKLRVGDFRSHEEAYEVMRNLKEAFPAFAKEMYIVREEIKVPLN